MAIHPDDEAPHPAPPQAIDIQAWTEQTTVALESMTIAPSPGNQVGVTSLHIPLDEHPAPRPAPVAKPVAVGNTGLLYKRTSRLQRDTQRTREALLRGKEGSRRRQKWENDHLLSNPYAQPPSAKDWEVRPTHPVHHVPYYLAPLWDAGLQRQTIERKVANTQAKSSTRTVARKPTAAGIVPKELREKLKKARGAKGLLMDLESEIRSFVELWEEKERRAAAAGFPTDPDTSDDEVVFVGRNGQMSDLPPSPGGVDDVEREMMVFEALVSDHSGAFGRWLVHHIGTYYGLRTWSVTRGDVREAYIGLREPVLRAGRTITGVCAPMPRPLWGIV